LIFPINNNMKKTLGVLALTLAIVLLLIYRQLTSSQTGADRPNASISAAAEASLVFGSLLIQ
jgi:hypothetical protein